MAVEQKIVLVDSVYVLRFDCGAKASLEGNTDITIVFNDVKIATIAVDSKKVIRKYFTLQAVVGNNILKFFSTAGIGLDNVDLRDIIEYPDMPSIQNGDFMLPSLGGVA